MQHARNCILQHARLRCHAWPMLSKQDGLVFGGIVQNLCASTSSTSDKLLDRVIGLVKKVGNIDASKVSEKADFQKDLSLDSLDKVELVMAFEQEFSIEIPDEEADKLTCCADVVRYIESEAIQNKEDKP